MASAECGKETTKGKQTKKAHKNAPKQAVFGTGKEFVHHFFELVRHAKYQTRTQRIVRQHTLCICATSAWCNTFHDVVHIHLSTSIALVFRGPCKHACLSYFLVVRDGIEGQFSRHARCLDILAYSLARVHTLVATGAVRAALVLRHVCCLPAWRKSPPLPSRCGRLCRLN